MKFDFKGLRFNTWLYFLGFSLSILLMLGILLIGMIKPYYRNYRVDTIGNISSTIENTLLSDTTTRKDIDSASKVVLGNNACAIIYNEAGKKIYTSDSLGQMCMFDEEITINDNRLIIENDPKTLISLMNSSPIISGTLISEESGNEMMIYAKTIRSKLANYYLVINTPLEPMESYVDFLMRQYMYLVIAVSVISFVVAYFLANRMSAPIIKIKNEAKKLADGNYELDLDVDSYSEVNNLAVTLDDATDKLSKVNELRKDLLANVSHDIKTPLTMIKAYAEMIEDISGDNPEKRKEHLDVIIREADYLNRLVTDMQELSKLQSGNIQINKTNCDLKEIAEEVLDLLDHLMTEKQITVTQEMDEAVVFADEIKMSQVMYNFISNAVKHSGEGTNITIRIKTSEEIVRVDVIDNGDGISEEDLPYIWDRYYKINKQFNRKIESTGLGLAIAKAILEAHKAKYGVISKPGQGSDFYFEISRDYDNEEE